MYLSDYCTVPMSLAGVPAISIPSGLAAAFRSASSSPRRRSPTTRCSTPPSRSSRRSRSTGAAPLSELEPVIGLEIHVQLKTRTKMFCGCELTFGAPPNTRTCPVCLGLPGSLPTVNEQAVRLGLMIGLALGSELAPPSVFTARTTSIRTCRRATKSPSTMNRCAKAAGLAMCGSTACTRRTRRADAHGRQRRIHGSDLWSSTSTAAAPRPRRSSPSRLAQRRAGRRVAAPLRTTLRQLGVSDVNMEEGSLRCDANISLRPAGHDALGTKTELKNMNSFRSSNAGSAPRSSASAR